MTLLLDFLAKDLLCLANKGDEGREGGALVEEWVPYEFFR